jgi:hypothetical protein
VSSPEWSKTTLQQKYSSKKNLKDLPTGNSVIVFPSPEKVGEKGDNEVSLNKKSHD